MNQLQKSVQKMSLEWHKRLSLHRMNIKLKIILFWDHIIEKEKSVHN